MSLTELLITLEAPIVVRPTRRMTQGEMENYLDKAADIPEEADKHCFPGWWNSTPVNPELSKALLPLVAGRFSALGQLAGDAMEFIGQLVQVLKRKHYKPRSKDA